MAISTVIKDTPVHAGDIVRVHQRIKEAEEKERIQIFEGMVIKIRGRGDDKTFTVRKISTGLPPPGLPGSKSREPATSAGPNCIMSAKSPPAQLLRSPKLRDNGLA